MDSIYFGLPVDYGPGNTGNAIATSYLIMRFQIPLLLGISLGDRN